MPAVLHPLLTILLATFSIGACADTARSGTPDRVEATVHATITELRRAHDVPGIAIAVIDGARIRSFTEGTIGADDAHPVGPDTLFELGSVSKLYTSLLAATAESQGRISLQHSPSRYLPLLRGAPVGETTLDQLGTYTAGEFPLQFPGDVNDERSVTNYFTAWQPSAPAGTTRRYSNPSIGLLGLATAAAYGTGYAAALQKHILGPLALRDTYSAVPETESRRYAWGRTAASARVRVSPGPLDTEAYGIRATARDVAAFTATFMSSAQTPAVRSALRPRYEVGTMRQALGWEGIAGPATLPRLQAANDASVANASRAVAPTSAEESCLLNKTGSTSGFGAYVLLHPGSRTAVVLLANRNVPIRDRIDAAFGILTAAAPGLSCSLQPARP